MNGERISQQSCEQEMARIRAQSPGLPAESVRERAHDELIGGALIRQNALNSGIGVTGSEIQAEYDRLVESFGGEADFYRRNGLSRRQEKRVRQDLRDRIRTEKLISQITEDIAPPTSDQVDAYYREHEAAMVKPASVHASHIVRPVDPKDPQATFREMLTVRRQLLEGADFAVVADSESSCEDSGGDLGTFSPGKMIEEFDVVIFSMNTGEVSPVFRTQFGYHVAKIWEAEPERTMTRGEAEEEIRRILHQRARDICVQDWIAEKRKLAVVEQKD